MASDIAVGSCHPVCGSSVWSQEPKDQSDGSRIGLLCWVVPGRCHIDNFGSGLQG